MMLQLISADERLAEKRGVKMLIVGPYGVGKTSRLRTLNSTSTLFLDIDAGDLAVRDVPCATFRPQTWPELRDLAVRIAGPNRAFDPHRVTRRHTSMRWEGGSITSTRSRPSSSIR